MTGEQFRWRLDPELRSEQNRVHSAGRPPPGKFRWRATAVLLCLLLLAASWWQHQWAAGPLLARRQALLQTSLDQAHLSLLAGDGALFFTHFTDEPAWQAAQLRPFNQSLHRAGAQVKAVTFYPGVGRADVTWSEGAQVWQRMVFFAQSGDGWRMAPPEIGYWGQQQRRDAAWGTLVYYRLDEPWAEAVTQFVDAYYAEGCPNACASEPLTLVLTHGYGETAVPHTLHMPSPRLIALDETGQPGPPFWDALYQGLQSQWQPIHLRFALPPLLPVGIHLIDYQQAAADFMAAHPHVTIELVTLPEVPQDPALLRGYDGAAFAPTPKLLAAGLVRDLTDFAATDPTFAVEDFYPQIWRGAWWRDRLWMVPLVGEMRLLYYDRHAFQEAGLADPSLRWTWAEMEANLQALDGVLPFGARPFPNYRFFDISSDVLFAYAFTQSQDGVTPESAAAALAWYQKLSDEPPIMADVTKLTAEERRQARFRWWASLWVDQLVYYEHHQQMVGNMGVVPFPGPPQFDGATPLHVYGSFITQSSQHPQAMWTWLAFLSHQQTAPRYRLIPARVSVAEANAYWSTLPRPLNEALRAAFPFARPVTLADQHYFTWEQITAVTTHQRTPHQAAQEIPALNWFTAR